MTGNSDVPVDTGYVEPGGRAPAPAPLRMAQVWANTADLEAGTDALDTPEHLVRWLEHQELIPPGEAADADDLTLAIDLREGLRALAGIHNGDDATSGDADVRRLERALVALPVELRTSGVTIETAPRSSTPVREALTKIALTVVQAGPDRLARLKACRRPVCRWVFYDSSRNRGSTWCAMEICGARTKMETYRARRTD